MAKAGFDFLTGILQISPAITHDAILGLKPHQQQFSMKEEVQAVKGRLDLGIWRLHRGTALCNDLGQYVIVACAVTAAHDSAVRTVHA